MGSKVSYPEFGTYLTLWWADILSQIGILSAPGNPETGFSSTVNCQHISENLLQFFVFVNKKGYVPNLFSRLICAPHFAVFAIERTILTDTISYFERICIYYMYKPVPMYAGKKLL